MLDDNDGFNDGADNTSKNVHVDWYEVTSLLQIVNKKSVVMATVDTKLFSWL